MEAQDDGKLTINIPAFRWRCYAGHEWLAPEGGFVPIAVSFEGVTVTTGPCCPYCWLEAIKRAAGEVKRMEEKVK